MIVRNSVRLVLGIVLGLAAAGVGFAQYGGGTGTGGTTTSSGGYTAPKGGYSSATGGPSAGRRRPDSWQPIWSYATGDRCSAVLKNPLVGSVSSVKRIRRRMLSMQAI